MVRVFRTDDERYVAGAVKALIEGLTTHNNPAGQAAHDAIMAGLSRQDRAAVDYAIAAVRLEVVTSDEEGGNGD